MIYYTIELQSGASGAGIIHAYTNVDDAREKYYDILKYAVKSQVRKHGAVVIDENGFIVEQPRVFEHEVQAQE